MLPCVRRVYITPVQMVEILMCSAAVLSALEIRMPRTKESQSGSILRICDCVWLSWMPNNVWHVHNHIRTWLANLLRKALLLILAILCMYIDNMRPCSDLQIVIDMRHLDLHTHSNMPPFFSTHTHTSSIIRDDTVLRTWQSGRLNREFMPMFLCMRLKNVPVYTLYVL